MADQTSSRSSAEVFVYLTHAEVAHAAGVTERTASRWARGEVTPHPRHARRLYDLWTLIEELTQNYTALGVQQWLRGRHRLLKARRPLDLIAAGEFDRVYEAAVAVSEGVFV